MKNLICFILVIVGQQAMAQLREGKHNLTLQWIGWDRPGKIDIKKNTDGTYAVEGRQVGNDKYSFLTVIGNVKVVSAQELLFDGTIITKVKNLYEGKECVKKGQFHFVAKGARQYWRLQEMENCEKNNVVDYVDIYFK